MTRKILLNVSKECGVPLTTANHLQYHLYWSGDTIYHVHDKTFNLTGQGILDVDIKNKKDFR